jgi:hypothetical protein
MAALDLFEHAGDRGDGNQFRALPEPGDRRQMAVGVFRPQVGDAQWAARGANAADQLAEDVLHGSRRKRTVVIIHHVLHDRRVVHVLRAGRLQATPERRRGALVQELDDLSVELAELGGRGGFL